MPRPPKGDEPLVPLSLKVRPPTRRTIRALAIVLGASVSQGDVVDRATALLVESLTDEERRKLEAQLKILP